MNNLGKILEKAEEKSGKKIVELVSKKEKNELLELSNFAVEEKSDEELESERKEVERRDQWCRSAAPILLGIRKRISEIHALMQSGPLSIAQQMELDHRRKKEVTLLAAGGDKSLADHLSFSVFLDEVRMAPVSKEMALIIMGRVTELGRYRLLSQAEADKKKKEWRETGRVPQGTQLLFGSVYMPFEPLPSEIKSAGQKAIESIVGQYLNKIRKAEKAKTQAGFRAVKEVAQTDLSLLRVGNIGVYKLFFPENIDARGNKWFAGEGYVEIFQRNDTLAIKVRGGIGSLQWLNKYENLWYPFSWYNRTEIPDSAPAKARELAERLNRAIGGALRVFYESQRK